MSRNVRISLIAQIGVSIVIAYMGGYGQNYIMQTIFIAVAFLLYSIFGKALIDQGSKLKNLISISLISVIGIILTVVSIVLYQVQVVDKYNYAFKPLGYRITEFLCNTFNASMIPLANFIGAVNKSFMLPYGLVFTFFIPTLIMWLSLERKIKGDAKKQEALFKNMNKI